MFIYKLPYFYQFRSNAKIELVLNMKYELTDPQAFLVSQRDCRLWERCSLIYNIQSDQTVLGKDEVLPADKKILLSDITRASSPTIMKVIIFITVVLVINLFDWMGLTQSWVESITQKHGRL